MLERQLITSKHTVTDIRSDMPELIEHFANQNNYADVVLNQINTDRFYDSFFENKNDLTVLDIGANIGLFALYVQDSARVVYTIEPTPGHFAKLQEMTKNFSNIKPLNIALHNKDELIDFYQCEFNSTMNSTVNNYGNAIPVKGQTLKNIITELTLDHIDFVKCDIEGSEMAALTFETVNEVKDLIDTWFIEVHSTNGRSTQENRDILAKIFEEVGYKVEQRVSDVIVVTRD